VDERKLTPEDQLRRQNEYLAALQETTLGLIRRLELTELLEDILRRSAALVGTEHGYIYLAEPDGTEMQIRVGIGWPSVVVGIRIKPGEGLGGKVWETGQPLVVDDYPSWAGRLIFTLNNPLHATVGVPLTSGSQVVGVIALAYLEPERRFGEEEVEILSRFAQLASVALENARLYAAAQAELAERKRAQAELELARDQALAANRAKSTFLTNMSHELRTPLNHIIGYSEIMLDEARESGQEHYIADLQKIRGAGRHLLTLISDLLDISKIEAGKMTLIPETFDILALANDVALASRLLIEKNGNTLQLNCPDDLGLIRTDVGKLRQMLMNLLNNAAKFTQQGMVTLTITREPDAAGDQVIFRVEDTGIGIAQEQMAHLFQPFVSLDSSITRRHGGTGLGLALCYHLSQMLGGEISVQSQPHQGSTFTLRVPAEVPDSQNKSSL
jgi:signal transduction histidine kinase